MNRKISLSILLLLVLAPLLGLIQIPPVEASPGWLPSWDKRVKITLDSGDIDAALSNFPVLIYLSASCGINSEDLTFVFDEVGANRKKIAVTTSDGTTECYVEVEKWDLGNEKAWLWAKIPSIASGVDTDIYLYFENDHADNDAYVGDPNSVPAENVWDANFVFVSHMRDDPDTSHIRDSTTEDNDGTKTGANEPIVTASGKIDSAQDFDGDNDKIGVTDVPALDASTLTLEVWVDIQEAGTHMDFIEKQDAPTDTGFELFRHNSNTIKIQAGDGVDWAVLNLGTIETYTTGWHYVVATNDGTDAFIYVDGTLKADGTGQGITIAPNAETMSLGGDSWWFNGIIDEARFSNIDRTPAWIKATYESGRDHLNDFGAEEEAPSNPVPSNMATNTTIENMPCEFSTYWDDALDDGLSHWIFSWDESGAYVNDTAVLFAGNPDTAWSNVTKDLPAWPQTILWKIYANDTLDNWGVTDEQTLVITYPMYPTLVGKTLASTATAAGYQRKTFHANGRYWDFYCESDPMAANGVYRSSTDGINWGSSTSIGTVTYGVRCLSVCFDGTYVHYARYDWSGEDLYYRRGIPQANGVVAWSAAEQLVNANQRYGYPMITVDTNGYAWIASRRQIGGIYRPYIIKNAYNNGSWTNAAGFPYELSDASDSIYWRVSAVPLTGGKVYAMYLGADMALSYPKGQPWNGTHWGAEENITTTYLTKKLGEAHSAVAIGDVVHFVHRNSGTPEDIIYVNRTAAGVWSEPEIVVDLPTYEFYVCPSLAKLNGDRLIVFYEAYDWEEVDPDTIRYKVYEADSWGSEQILVTEPSGIHSGTTWSSITSSYDPTVAGVTGVLYMNGTATPYDVRYALFTDVVPIVTAGIHNPDMIDSDRWIFEGRKQYEFYINVSYATDGAESYSAGIGFYDEAGDWYSFLYDHTTEEIVLVSPDDGILATLKDVETGTTWLYVNFTVIFNSDIADTSDVDLYARRVTPEWGDSGWYLHTADYFNIYNLGGYATLETSGWAGRSPGGDVFEIYAADTRTGILLSLENFDVDDQPLPAGTKIDWWGWIPVGTSIVPADEAPLLDLLIGWDLWMSQRLPNQTIMITNRLPSGSGGDADAYYSYPFGLRTLARPITTNGLMAEKEFRRQVTSTDDEIVYVQIYAMTPQTMNTTGKILITDDGYVDDLKAHAALDSLQVVDLVFAGDGRIRLTNGVAGYIYPATYTGLTWYNFTFEINCTAQNYNMYVDGVLNATDVDFRQKVAGADTVGHITIMDISVVGNYTDVYVDDIKAWTDWDEDYGGDAKATALFRYLQHWSMDWDFKIEEGREYTKGPTTTPWDSSDDYSNHGYIELGMDVCINGTWEDNFLVARINITDGMVYGKSNWVQFNVTWMQNGTYVKHDIIYGFFEGYKLETQPGDVKDTTGWYFDMWFNRMNASTVVGGRLNTEYFGMTNQPTFSWGDNWKPVYSDFTESSCFVDLLDSNGIIHSAKEVSLVRPWVHVFRTNQSTFHYAIANTETEFPTAEDTMSGIDTPPIQETIAPQGASLGGLGPYLASALNRIMGGLGDSIFGGLLVVTGRIQRSMMTLTAGLAASLFTGFSAILGALIAFIDDIAAAAGLPEDLMSTMVSIVTSTMGFMVTMIAEGYIFDVLTNIFTFITSIFGHVLFWLTRVLTTFTNIFTIVWGILDGTYVGLGEIQDVWALMNWPLWSDALPLFIIIGWFDSLDNRWRAAGRQGWVGYLVGDLRLVKEFLMFLLDVGTWVIQKSVVLFERIVNLIPL